MIYDVFGHGQYVKHALMKDESSGCLADAVTSFKSASPTWEKVRAIIVDKYFGEIALLQTQFPGARILLCVFHVVKYLRGEITKHEYGGFLQKAEPSASFLHFEPLLAKCGAIPIWFCYS
ncbi:hypothetical protein PR003_g32984 [Phytophthora rubi]|uniref:ZSWIM1/3 RNaseH-like domain-containing protein n=1 Tax=Phytophthora rubi TaxID=129364 RepID=A0A6A3GHE4_9STRA|nr:hypothetical protein PR002_g31641 [Phytophthora rubi]KAE9263907.1 hypothetical protein PR003_g32984 [Phytophthora rubi]